jgi:hypothetical protein
MLSVVEDAGSTSDTQHEGGIPVLIAFDISSWTGNVCGATSSIKDGAMVDFRMGYFLRTRR